LVPVDGSAPAQAGLEQAVTLARSNRARLRLLHVVDASAVLRGPEPAISVGDLFEMLAEDGRKVLARGADFARKRGVKAETALHELHLGRVADRILSEMAKWKADLIVMGTHGRRGIGRLVMGSDAESVLRESGVPVLLVKARAARKAR
jgi:nucleotide-binding universal stress UspA family protein